MSRIHIIFPLRIIGDALLNFCRESRARATHSQYYRTRTMALVRQARPFNFFLSSGNCLLFCCLFVGNLILQFIHVPFIYFLRLFLLRKKEINLMLMSQMSQEIWFIYRGYTLHFIIRRRFTLRYVMLRLIRTSYLCLKVFLYLRCITTYRDASVKITRGSAQSIVTFIKTICHSIRLSS